MILRGRPPTSPLQKLRAKLKRPSFNRVAVEISPLVYGPPPDCKRFEVRRRDSLRKCIRPLPRNSHSGSRVFRLQLQQREIPTSRRSI
jgi:hypothetical protein